MFDIIYIYIYTHRHTDTHTYIYIYIYIHTYIYTWYMHIYQIYKHICTPISMYIYNGMSACKWHLTACYLNEKIMNWKFLLVYYL